MNRKLTLAMLLSLSAASPLVQGLGLGEADVRSTLNAPLRATLPLSDTAGMQAGLLNVSVADERAFEAAGLTRTPLAASVRLAVEQRQGRLVVDLTTERPVREPWLDLLLRFDWPGGQQLREVTLLLDPPDYDQMPALVPGSRRVAVATTATASPSAPASTSAPSVAGPGAATASGNSAWVNSGDTLWAVAGRLRPDSGISMNQVMVALIDANPEAFPSGNINAMRAGLALVVPSREAMAARNAADADRIVAAMNQAWANRGSGAPVRVPMGPTQAVAASAPAEAAAPVETAAADADSTAELDEEAASASPTPARGEDEEAEGPRLTLLTDAEAAAEVGEGSEESAATSAEVSADAEGDAGGGLPTAGELSPQVVVDPELLAALRGEGSLSSDERLVRLEAGWLESQQALEAVQEERDQLQEELGEMRGELAVLRDQLAALVAGGAGVDAPGAGGVAPLEAEEGNASWWGSVYQGGLDRSLMLGGAGLAALLALWLVVRRRRQREADDATRGGFGEVRVALPGAEVPVSPRGATSPQAVASGSVQSTLPQAEAINEADIFIAYGRYEQARDLLEASLAREPERDDLRLKLLMVHLEQGERELAREEAARLREGGNPAVRDEVAYLLERHGLAESHEAPPSDVRPSQDAARAVFSESAELPPRVLDEPEEAGTSTAAQAPAAAAPSESPAQAAGRDRPVEPPAAEPPAQMPSSEPKVEEKVEEKDKPSAQEALPEVMTRQREDGSEIIDYQPPPLDPSPAPREETPMQPSVEFTPARTPVPGPADSVAPSGHLGESGTDERGVAASRAEGDRKITLPDDWEVDAVEEVAFPPLPSDNEPSNAGAPPDAIADARRLVADGREATARELLDRLRQDADPAVREEAQALLNRLDK